MCVCLDIQLCPTLGNPTMGFSRQEYWSGQPFSSPGDLPDSGIDPRSTSLHADSLPSEPPGSHMHISVDTQYVLGAGGLRVIP